MGLSPDLPKGRIEKTGSLIGQPPTDLTSYIAEFELWALDFSDIEERK
jgi:hypothetical protein